MTSRLTWRRHMCKGRASRGMNAWPPEDLENGDEVSFCWRSPPTRGTWMSAWACKPHPFGWLRGGAGAREWEWERIEP